MKKLFYLLMMSTFVLVTSCEKNDSLENVDSKFKSDLSKVVSSYDDVISIEQMGTLHNGALEYIAQSLAECPTNCYGIIEMDSAEFMDFVYAKSLKYFATCLATDEEMLLWEMSSNWRPIDLCTLTTVGSSIFLEIQSTCDSLSQENGLYEESSLRAYLEEEKDFILGKYSNGVLTELDYQILYGYIDVYAASLRFWADEDNLRSFVRPITPSSFNLQINWRRCGKQDAHGFWNAINNKPYDHSKAWIHWLNAALQAVSASAWDLICQSINRGYVIQTENEHLHVGGFYVYPTPEEIINGEYDVPFGIYFRTYPQITNY